MLNQKLFGKIQTKLDDDKYPNTDRMQRNKKSIAEFEGDMKGPVTIKVLQRIYNKHKIDYTMNRKINIRLKGKLT